MRLYLDAVGGVAGDMFAAAILDAWPDLGPRLLSALDAAGLPEIVTVGYQPFTDGTLSGTRFHTTPAGAEETATVLDHHHGSAAGHDHASPADHGSVPADVSTGRDHAHRRHRDIVAWLERATVSPPVRARALDIFRLLAEAEARVHGISPADVEFHEVGAWDSIADVLSAAWLLDALGPAEWFAAPLPMGRGRVHTAHGELPLPAPATALLLEGFPLFQDGRDGERVTPTGAAILRHLAPRFEPLGCAGRLAGSGTGFGTRRFPGLSNVLRLLRFDDDAPGDTETIGVCQFEIDDQSPEDLAVGLERLRVVPGVIDVGQSPVLGKKGRVGARIQILTDAAAIERAVAAALRETTTLGVRWQTVSRTVVPRTVGTVLIDGEPIRVKRARRPGGLETVKAELDDVAGSPHDRARREARRRRAESSGDPQPSPGDG